MKFNEVATITWINVDLSSLRSSDVHRMAISLEISQPSVTKISLKIIFLRTYWNSPGANELSNIFTTWEIIRDSNLGEV